MNITSIRRSIIAAAAMGITVAASARYHQPHDYPRVLWDTSTQKVLFQAGNYARLIPLADGRLMCAAETYGPSGVGVCYSSDNGKNWSTPSIIAPNPDRVGNAVPDLIQLSDGTILVGYNPRPNAPYSPDRRFGIRVMRSTDNGKSWEGPIYVYDASHDYIDGCWEPSFLELPSGEVHCYFANEHPYTNSGEQEISMCRSFDKGATWSAPERVTFRAGHRDGMPSAIITDAGEIVVIVEDNGQPGYGGFRATTLRCTLEQNWHDCWVDGASSRRNMIFANETDKQALSAAPYIRRLPSGYTLASWQGLAGGRTGGNEDMFVAVGNKDARQFQQVSRPFACAPDSRSLWNSINVGFGNRVYALGSLSGPNEGAKITLLEGIALEQIQANYGTPVVNGSFSGEDWTAPKAAQIVLGQTCRTRSTHDFLYDSEYLYMFNYVQDNVILTDQIEKDGVWLYLDLLNASDVYPQTGMYRFFINVDGTVDFATGGGNKWTKAASAPEGIKYTVNRGRTYYMQEIAIPWKALGMTAAPTGTVLRANIELSDRRESEHRKEAIPDTYVNQSWSWPELRLNAAPDGPDGIDAATDSANLPVGYYTLQGVRVAAPTAPGLYLRRQGPTTTKTLIR